MTSLTYWLGSDHLLVVLPPHLGENLIKYIIILLRIQSLLVSGFWSWRGLNGSHEIMIVMGQK